MTPTCLIAEADLFIVRLLRRFAAESGMESLQARTGQEALDLARQAHPDVIILEPELPGKLRGWEVYHHLRSDEQTAGIPVIACSWLPPGEARARLGEPGPVLQKPELYYEDFVLALQKAGVNAGSRSVREKVDPPA